MDLEAGLNILVVEDEQVARNFLITNLKELGHQVEAATNGHEALELFEINKPDIVLIDLYLPGINGFQLISRLSSSYPQLPLIAISATEKIQDAVQSMRLGAWDFLIKSGLKIDDIYDSLTRCIIKYKKLIASNNPYKDNENINLKNIFTESIINFFPFGFFIRDKYGNFKIVNKVFANFFGISQEQIQKINFSELYEFINVNPKYYRDALQEEDNKLLSGKKNIAKRELYFIDKNGSPVWLHIFKVSAKISENEYEVIGFAIDLSERKILEERLKKLKDKAEIANKAKSQFIANISHEFRTPLNAVMGMIQLVLDEEELSDTNKEMLKISKQSAQKLLHIVNSILEISKMEYDNIELHPEEFNLKRLLEQTIDEFYSLTKEKKIELTYYLDQYLPCTCVCDHIYLKQIIKSLLSNAIKFTPQGSIEVKAKNDLENGGIVFSVKDTGIGIADEKQNIIFEKFTIAEDILTKRYGGIGVGLSLSQKLLHKMNGKIWVDSKLGEGSTFSFFLPFESLGASCMIPIPNYITKNKYLHILFAEDDSSNLIYGQLLLEKMGHKVQLAKDGKQALKHLKNNNFDLAIIDFKMPIINGSEVVSTIRNGNSVNKNIPIIITTAHLQDKHRKVILRSGADSYLQKPYSSEDLYSHINNIIYKYQLEPQSD